MSNVVWDLESYGTEPYSFESSTLSNDDNTHRRLSSVTVSPKIITDNSLLPVADLWVCADNTASDGERVYGLGVEVNVPPSDPVDILDDAAHKLCKFATSSGGFDDVTVTAKSSRRVSGSYGTITISGGAITYTITETDITSSEFECSVSAAPSIVTLSSDVILTASVGANTVTQTITVAITYTTGFTFVSMQNVADNIQATITREAITAQIEVSSPTSEIIDTLGFTLDSPVRVYDSMSESVSTEIALDKVQRWAIFAAFKEYSKSTGMVPVQDSRYLSMERVPFVSRSGLLADSRRCLATVRATPLTQGEYCTDAGGFETAVSDTVFGWWMASAVIIIRAVFAGSSDNLAFQVIWALRPESEAIEPLSRCFQSNIVTQDGTLPAQTEVFDLYTSDIPKHMGFVGVTHNPVTDQVATGFPYEVTWQGYWPENYEGAIYKPGVYSNPVTLTQPLITYSGWSTTITTEE